jgi:excisionase family DNA binding protein
MAVLEEFRMKKINSSVFNYPIVTRKVGNEIFFSVPDLGFWKSIKIDPKNDEEISAKSANLNKSDFVKKSIEVTDDFRKLVAKSMIDIWFEIEDHLKTKKWIPDPSQIKQSLQTAEDDFTLPDFTKKLNQYMTVSENTVRREIKRGVIQCYQTDGGHRRIPYSELQKYISNQKSNLKQGVQEINESTF